MVGAKATLAGTAVALKDAAREEWWIWKLRSKDLEERKFAAERLGEVGSARAIPHILELWREVDDREFRFYQRPSLQCANIEFDPDLPEYAEPTLFKLGSKAPDRIIRGLDDRSEYVRLASARTLLMNGPPANAIPALTRTFQEHRFLESRSFAALALLKLGPAARSTCREANKRDIFLESFILREVRSGMKRDPEACEAVRFPARPRRI